MKRNIKKGLLLRTRGINRFVVMQSAMAGAYILLVYLVTHSLKNYLAVTSLGASAFIVFSFPKAPPSSPRTLVGGYSSGILSGLLCFGLCALLDLFLPVPAYIPSCAISVFMATLLMNVFKVKHPPAAALAAAITLDSNPFALSLAAFGCIIVLCVFKETMKKHLRNLD